MAYRTILTILRNDALIRMQVAAAAELARRFDAHLDILCMGVDQVQVGYYFAGADAIVQQTSIEHARETAEATLKAAEAAVEAEGVRWSARALVAQFGALSDVIGEVARFADLAVLPKPYGEVGEPDDAAILEAALFTGQAPVLVLPETGLPDDFGARAAIGWNDGTEALTAVRAALPFLQAAEKVNIVFIDPPQRPTGATGAGESLARMLDRHGVKTEIDLLPKTHPRISEVLTSHVTDLNASLLVTGAYGHSRFRQAILGGATREILTDATVPVLMAH